MPLGTPITDLPSVILLFTGAASGGGGYTRAPHKKQRAFRVPPLAATRRRSVDAILPGMSEIDPAVAAPNPKHVYTLHRYYTWSTILKGHFEDVLAEFRARGEAFSMKTDDGIRGYAYMSYWYAALYVVIEGWQKLGLHDPKIDELLESPNLELLKLYRHSVFHFHEDYFNEPLTTPFVERGEPAVIWVRSLSNEFGRWFLEWFRARSATGS